MHIFRAALNRLVLAFGILATPHTAAASGQYTIDSNRTVVNFEIRYLGLFTQHGKFNQVAGSVNLDPPAGKGSLEIVIDAQSISADNEHKEKFMRGKDVFNVEKFPEIRYEAQSVTFTDGKPEQINGQLTFLGVTKPVQLSVAYYRCTEPPIVFQPRCEFGAFTTIHRSEFGMTKLWSFVSDTVKLSVEAEAQLAETLPER